MDRRESAAAQFHGFLKTISVTFILGCCNWQGLGDPQPSIKLSLNLLTAACCSHDNVVGGWVRLL